MGKIELKYILQELDENIVLDNEQIAILEEMDHNIFIIAGAGSGKTTTMVAKIKYLVEYKQIKPYDILLIAFTKQAVLELRHKLWDQLGIYVSIVTFHKLGLEIIKRQNGEQKIITDVKTEIDRLIAAIVQVDLQFFRQLKQYLGVHFNHSYEQICLLPSYIQFLSDIVTVLEQKRVRQTEIRMNRKNIVNRRKNALFIDLYIYLEMVYYHHMVQRKQIDFTMMIDEATTCLQQKTVEVEYRYIMVDEYQDISKNRLALLKALEQQTKAYMIAVGDDWQAIYHFSGSDHRLFRQFTEYFSPAKVFYLLQTYRNSQELIDVAGAFVMKSSEHLPKQLISGKHCCQPLQLLYCFPCNCIKRILCLLDHLNKEGLKIIYFLGRYQHDIRILQSIKVLRIKGGIIESDQFPNLTMYFFTVHAVKGLGCDEVIILNMTNKQYGFPANVSKNNILTLLEDQSWSQELEERRLFYVALTRTKHRVYIIVPWIGKSSYIREIKKESMKKFF